MKQIHHSKRAKMTGKGADATFVRWPHFVLNSSEIADLSGSEARMLLELVRQYNGRNNGDLSATYELAKHRGWPSEATMWKALKGLQAKGWIVTTRQGGRHIGCSLYAITWLPVDECDGKHHYPAERKASHLWKRKK